MAKRISIINFKGGVGKTTLALNLAGYLSYYHKKKVLLIDVDHQSSLSFVVLDSDEWTKRVDEGKTINAIFEHFINSEKKIPGREIIVKDPYGNLYPGLDLVPASLQLDEIELDLTSTTMGDPIESEWKKRSLICDWIEKNGIDEEYDYIIFDCPPATKIVTQNAIAASHCYIVPVIPDAVSTRGVPHLINRVFMKIDKKFSSLAEFLKAKGKAVSPIYEPNTKLAGIVISKIKRHGLAYSGYTSDQTRYLRKLEGDYPNDIVKTYIVEGVGVPEALTRGYPVYRLSGQNIEKMGFVDIFKNVSEELKRKIDTI